MIQVQLDPNLTMKLDSIDKKLDLLVKRANRETERLKMNPLSEQVLKILSTLK
jgi:hypothetical protein